MVPGNVSRYKPELTPKENSLFRVILLRYFVATAYKSVAEIGRIVAHGPVERRTPRGLYCAGFGDGQTLKPIRPLPPEGGAWGLPLPF